MKKEFKSITNSPRWNMIPASAKNNCEALRILKEQIDEKLLNGDLELKNFIDTLYETSLEYAFELDSQKYCGAWR